MNGINLFLLYIFITILLILTILLSSISLSASIFIYFIIGSIFLLIVYYVYSSIRVNTVNKGELIYQTKKYNSICRLIVFAIGITFLIYFRNEMPYMLMLSIETLLIIYLFFGDYLIGNSSVKVYDEGIVFDDILYCEWDDLSIEELENGAVNIATKNYPKKIKLHKNLIKRRKSLK